MGAKRQFIIEFIDCTGLFDAIAILCRTNEQTPPKTALPNECQKENYNLFVFHIRFFHICYDCCIKINRRFNYSSAQHFIIPLIWNDYLSCLHFGSSNKKFRFFLFLFFNSQKPWKLFFFLNRAKFCFRAFFRRFVFSISFVSLHF